MDDEMEEEEENFMTLVPKKYSVSKLLSRSHTRELVFRHGHIAITSYHMGDNRDFEKSLSSFDEVRYRYDLKGGYYVEELEEFRINRGYDLGRLRDFFPSAGIRVENDAYPADKVKIALLAEPRDDFQRVALTFMCSQGEYWGNKSYTQQIIDADTGDGKAQPDDTIIPTPSGPRPLCYLKQGDKVFNRYGDPVTVLRIFPQAGLQDTYRVTFDDGRSTRCNLEHLWPVIGPLGSHKVMTTKQLINDYKQFGRYRYKVEMPGPVEFKERSTPIPPRTLGKHIHDMDATGALMYKIPDCYRFNTIENRKEFFRGLFDDPEYDRKSFVRVDISSRGLGKHILEIARSLGYRALCEKVTSTFGMKDRILVYINQSAKRGTLAITSIDKLSQTHQRCILIDDPEHIYITEGYIPTHNTYCGVAAPCFYQARAVVFAPSEKVIKQWKESYLKFTDLEENEVLIVKGSKICREILQKKHKDVKIFIFSVDTLRSFCDTYGNLDTIDMLRETNAYVKIVDEVHKDMAAVSMIEALSNFHLSFYMSATAGRTDRKENWIFSTCFRNVPRFGSQFKVQEELHLNIIVKQYSFTPTMAQQKRMVNARTKWLNSKAYETELISAPPVQNGNFCTAVTGMLKWSKRLLKDGNRILILSETIAGTEFTRSLASEVFPSDECARYYGSMKPKEKEEALKKTVICATVASLGTGADIPGIQHVYNITTYSSWISAVQTAGRARKLKDGTPVFYIELVNFGYIKTLRQYEKRKPTLLRKSRTGKIVMIE